MALLTSVLAPPYTLVNQFFAISYEFLLSFQNLNSSMEPLNLPDPVAALLYAGAGVRAPILATIPFGFNSLICADAKVLILGLAALVCARAVSRFPRCRTVSGAHCHIV